MLYRLPPLAAVFRHPGDDLSADQDTASVQRNTAADNVQHGGFSRAIAAHHGYKLPVRNGEIEIFKQAHLIDRTRIVKFFNIF